MKEYTRARRSGFCGMTRLLRLTNTAPTGRKTAALRILEVSHELDRLAFLDGDSDEFVDMLRAIAARLYANASAAKQDHRYLVSCIKGTRQHLQESKADDAIKREVTAIVELVELVADILRPFVS